LLNEELHNLYCSPNIIRIIKSRRARGSGQVACKGETRNTKSVRKSERKYLEDRGRDRKIILKQTSKKQGKRVWAGFIWIRAGTSGRLLLAF
jgi:hypothetical protein